MELEVRERDAEWLARARYEDLVRADRAGREGVPHQPPTRGRDPRGELAWEAKSLGLRMPTATRFAPDDDGTTVTLEADTRGPLAFPYRLALPEREQALLFVEMLNRLAGSFK